MQQLVILLLISCSSTCFGRLYAHPQEARQVTICSNHPVGLTFIY